MALISKISYVLQCDFCHTNRGFFYQSPAMAVEDAEYHGWMLSPDGRTRCDRCPPQSERFIDFATASVIASKSEEKS